MMLLMRTAASERCAPLSLSISECTEEPKSSSIGAPVSVPIANPTPSPTYPPHPFVPKPPPPHPPLPSPRPAKMEYLRLIHNVFTEPLLCHLNLLTPGGGDPTFGRSDIPYSASEHRLIYSNPEVSAIRRRVLIPAHSLLESGSWTRRSGRL